jgi:hypothetical protein
VIPGILSRLLCATSERLRRPTLPRAFWGRLKGRERILRALETRLRPNRGWTLGEASRFALQILKLLFAPVDERVDSGPMPALVPAETPPLVAQGGHAPGERRTVA